MTRRQRAYAIAEKTMKENDWSTRKELRKVLRDAYPWYPRANWPYKVWLSVVNTILDSHFPPVVEIPPVEKQIEDLPMFQEGEEDHE